MRKKYKLECGDHVLYLGERTCIMGILNVTPDSFSDGGKFVNCDAAVSHAEKMVEAGADIIDIGGESTRPFSEAVPIEDEIQRVMPVIEQLADKIPVPISIDTTKAEVARQAVAAGASIINDISALRLDPDMAGVVAGLNVPVIIMHMKDSPKDMQVLPEYDDLIKEVKAFLYEAVETAENNSIKRSKIVIDPGIGFGKNFAHNFTLLKHIDDFSSLDIPILVGPSRKAFIRNRLKVDSEKDLSPDLPVVEIGSQAAIAASILNGAHIVRVHDVAGTVATAKIIDAVNGA